MVQTLEVVKELESRRRQVHDKVGNGRWYRHPDGLGTLFWWCAPREFGLDNGAVTSLIGFEDEVGSLLDEGVAVFVEGLDVFDNLGFTLSVISKAHTDL